MPTEIIDIEILDNPLPNLVTWLPIEGKNADFASLDWQGNTETLMCTHPKKPAILNAMVDMISSAKYSVFLFNWMLNHPVIEKSLVAAAKRLNGRVHVLTTLETSIHSRYTDEEKAMNDLSRLQELAANGVYIRLHPEAHAKFLIVDDELLVTSANIRDTSLEKNIETGIRVSDSITVTSFRSFFSHLWLHEAKQHIRPSKNDPRLGNPWSQTSTPDAPNASANAIWTLSNRRMSLAKAIISAIKFAKKTLRISTYALSSTESGIGKQLIDELVTASKKGVEITILYHATNKAIGRPPRGHEALGFLRLMACKGVSMRGHPDLHAKHIIADHSKGLLFTANLDGNHGLNSGIEVGVDLSEDASRHLAKWHDTLFASFPFELVYSPKSTELANREGTKLLELNTTLLCSNKEHDTLKNLISAIPKSPVVLCKRKERWIPPETKHEREKPKPYEPRVAVPSIKSGYIVGGILLGNDDGSFTAKLSKTPDYGLHHAHVKPGQYSIELIRPFTDDEILAMIENHLPASKNGVALKEIVDTMKVLTSHPNLEIHFPLTDKGLTEYIQSKSNRGLLRSHELQEQKLMPVLSKVEAAELLKDLLDSGDKVEMQNVLDNSNKPHNFTISNKLIKQLRKLLTDDISE